MCEILRPTTLSKVLGEIFPGSLSLCVLNVAIKSLSTRGHQSQVINDLFCQPRVWGRGRLSRTGLGVPISPSTGTSAYLLKGMFNQKSTFAEGTPLRSYRWFSQGKPQIEASPVGCGSQGRVLGKPPLLSWPTCLHP